MIDSGNVYTIASKNEIVEGCTVSLMAARGAVYFSLAKHTDISEETYPGKKLFLIDSGAVSIFNGSGFGAQLKENQAILIKESTPIGVKTENGAIYTEFNIRSDSKMNEIIKEGNVFSLKELVPYQEGKIVNMDVVRNEKMKFVVMAFDEETGLSEHAAPGEALIFVLDGEGIIGYEGKEYPVKAGENFKFAKQGKHYVKATKKLKIALFLTLD